MATIGKSSSEVERVDVPHGLVHQRRALFGESEASSLPTFATPADVPSSSVTSSRRDSVGGYTLIHSDHRRHVNIEVTRLHAPADLVRRSPDDDVSQLQRRVVLVRHPVNQEPTITVNEVRNERSTQRTLSVNRVFPIVSIRVAEQVGSEAEKPSPSKSSPAIWQARPPAATSIFRSPGTGPIHKQFLSTPTNLNEIRPIEGVDTVTYDKRPMSPPKDYPVKAPDLPPAVKIIRKAVPRPVSMDVRSLEKQAALALDDIYRKDDDLESEIAEKEAELDRAKSVIEKLSHDLEKLEKDRNTMEGSYIMEEDVELSDLEENVKTEREKKVLLDAEEILRECNRMMVQLKEEEEADQKLLEKIQRGDTSDEEIQQEILRLQRQVSELNAMGIELPPLLSAKQGSRRSEDTSQIVSLKEQAVMFSTGGAAARQEALISRLERELTDAQTCNHRLNAQLGTLANNNESTLKKEYTDLKVDLFFKTNKGNG